MQLSLKTFLWMSWNCSELPTLLFSLDPLVATVRLNPKRKFFSHSCCNLICCLEMQGTVWECACYGSLGRRGDFLVSWLGLHLPGCHWMHRSGAGTVTWAPIWAKPHSVQGERRHGQRKERESWTSNMINDDSGRLPGSGHHFGWVVLHVWLTFCFSFLVLVGSCDIVTPGWAWSHKSWV